MNINFVCGYSEFVLKFNQGISGTDIFVADFDAEFNLLSLVIKVAKIDSYHNCLIITRLAFYLTCFHFSLLLNQSTEVFNISEIKCTPNMHLPSFPYFISPFPIAAFYRDLLPC